MTSARGFKAKMDPLLVCFVACMQWIHLSVTSVDLLAAKIVQPTYLHMSLQVLVGLEPVIKHAAALGFNCLSHLGSE